VLATFTDPRAALRKVPVLRPDILVFDLDMPGISGTELMQQLAAQLPDLRFILLTMHLEQGLVRRLMQQGLHGYLLKNDDREDFLHALEAVAGGKRYYSPRVAEVLVDERRAVGGGVRLQLTELTARERDILRCIAEGLSSRDIAEALFISVGTVDSHRKALMRKLDVHNVAALVRIAVREGLVD
jgi:DNA-binding NarL/FixJ family response regulator